MSKTVFIVEMHDYFHDEDMLEAVFESRSTAEEYVLSREESFQAYVDAQGFDPQRLTETWWTICEMPLNP